MKRRAFLSALAGLAPLPAAEEACPVEVKVVAGPAVEVTIPNFAKWQLTQIVATFLGRDNPRATAAVNKVLGTAKDLTLIVTTTKCGTGAQ